MQVYTLPLQSNIDPKRFEYLYIRKAEVQRSNRDELQSSKDALRLRFAGTLMYSKFFPTLLLALVAAFAPAVSPAADSELISPNQPIVPGKAPHMQVKQVNGATEEKAYVIIFHKGDDALSGLVDFATRNKVRDAHFTAIGAVSSATLGWLDLVRKAYHPILITEQSEVLSMVGDIAEINGKPSVHTHVALGDHNGQTKGGHVWKLIVNPTLEVFVSVHPLPLEKKPDSESGMNMIDLQ
jgi:predicted DNA-binding protein with PD1-like motif